MLAPTLVSESFHFPFLSRDVALAQLQWKMNAAWVVQGCLPGGASWNAHPITSKPPIRRGAIRRPAGLCIRAQDWPQASSYESRGRRGPDSVPGISAPVSQTVSYFRRLDRIPANEGWINWFEKVTGAFDLKEYDGLAVARQQQRSFRSCLCVAPRSMGHKLRRSGGKL